jgi:hypothetical protein
MFICRLFPDCDAKECSSLAVSRAFQTPSLLAIARFYLRPVSVVHSETRGLTQGQEYQETPSAPASPPPPTQGRGYRHLTQYQGYRQLLHTRHIPRHLAIYDLLPAALIGGSPKLHRTGIWLDDAILTFFALVIAVLRLAIWIVSAAAAVVVASRAPVSVRPASAPAPTQGLVSLATALTRGQGYQEYTPDRPAQPLRGPPRQLSTS